MSNFQKFVVCSDVHGDEQDPRTVKVCLDFCDIWKPNLRIMAGDLWDFRPLRKKACDDERRQSMAQDYEAGSEFLRAFKPDYFLRGNHCERLWELAEEDRGIESDYAIKAVAEIEKELKAMRCRMLPYHKRDGVLRLGHLKILHGFASGVYAARTHALVYGSCLFGHTHAIDEHAIPGLERRVARNIGALCKLDMEYNSRHIGTLKQAHGFAYGIIHKKSGTFHVWQAEEIGGKWILPTDTVTL